MTDLNTPQDLAEEDSINLLEIATALGEEKKTIASIAGAITLLAVIISLVMTPIFTAKTTFITPSASAGGSAAQALANLGGLMAGGGAASLLGTGKSPDEMYMEFLKTKTLQNTLITKFDLQKRYDKADLEKTQKELKARTQITSNKKAGLITVEIDDEDRQFAADLANAYVLELKEMLKDFAVTEAQQRKKYYEEQLIRVKKELAGITDYREMKVRESVMAVVMNQYEVALLDTAREGVLQITEKAVPPLKKSKPKRMIIVLVAAIAGLFLGVLWVLIRRALVQARNNPEGAKQWANLRSAWRWR
jgi:tyrosine-protein kinase Etk/Wzc